MRAKGALLGNCIPPNGGVRPLPFLRLRFWLPLAVSIQIAACGGGSGNSKSSAALNWDSDPTIVAGYRIYYGTQSGAYIQKNGQGMDAGQATSYTVTGLDKGARYYFAVTGYNELGYESGYSNEVFKDIP